MREADGKYRLDNEPTRKQKDMPDAFNVDADWVKREVAKALRDVDKEA